MSSLLVLGMIIFLVGMITETYILYYLTYIFVGLSIMLKIYNNNIRNNLSITHSIDDSHIFLKEKTSCRIEMSNQGKIPVFWVKVNEILPIKLTTLRHNSVVQLGSGETITREFELRGKRRGYYTLGPLRWRSGDIFGYKDIGDVVEEESFFVFPKILSLAELGLPSRIPYGKMQWPQPIFKDPVKNAGIREYQPGDRMNKVHWKATARTGEIKVRKAESTVSLETAVVLDLAQGSYGLSGLEPNTELAITTAASIGAYLTRQKQIFKFISNGKDPISASDDLIISPAAKGEGHLQKILEILARIEFDENEEIDTFFNHNLDLSWGATVIIITKTDTEKIINWCLNLLARGYSVKLLLVGGRVVHKQYLHLPFTAPLTIYQVSSEEDLYAV
ncbi:MAG: DUF58 domain-containing protein [Halothermotrichaceae bacterium]